MCKFAFIFLLSLLTSGLIRAEGTGAPGNWINVPIFNQAPLEAKIGIFSDDINPDLAIVVLWNDGNNNRLDAIKVPPPYDGTGITTTFLENTNNLFALGDICTDGINVVVPYIKNFNVEIARFNGLSWSKSTLPGTKTNNFDNADCATTTDGIFISTHDLSDGETEFFKSNNSGNSYTFYGRYMSSGPFDGAIREPLATSFGDRYAMTVYQNSSGMVRTAKFNTADNPPVFNHTNIEQLPAPTGFTFVKEGAGVFNGAGITVTYNANGSAKAVDIPATDPSAFTSRDLGIINNNGSQFNFQGGTVLSVLDENNQPMQNNVLWGDYHLYRPFNPSIPPEEDNNFPFAGVGGPVDGCVARKTEGTVDLFLQAFFVASRVGSDGTDLFKREIAADPIFADGFESGDVSSWSMTCP
ncbi:hypothetical protein [Marinicella litoralis]|uniref:Uncharacterized protein n=1 Tax=Marinicella litoralis TaxID=644220 RepID=A0A4R6XN64_9GAMM|nr:hypothetical protein [Marinicella litoralis]TDR17568.1 hypothetical protein C8D91_2627 [Marinicella litoralis]